MDVQTMDSFLEYLDRVRARTDRVIRCIPKDKFDWTYKAGKFTFADMIRLFESQLELYSERNAVIGSTRAALRAGK